MTWTEETAAQTRSLYQRTLSDGFASLVTLLFHFTIVDENLLVATLASQSAKQRQKIEYSVRIEAQWKTRINLEKPYCKAGKNVSYKRLMVCVHEIITEGRSPSNVRVSRPKLDFAHSYEAAPLDTMIHVSIAWDSPDSRDREMLHLDICSILWEAEYTAGLGIRLRFLITLSFLGNMSYIIPVWEAVCQKPSLEIACCV